MRERFMQRWSRFLPRDGCDGPFRVYFGRGRIWCLELRKSLFFPVVRDLSGSLWLAMACARGLWLSSKDFANLVCVSYDNLSVPSRETFLRLPHQSCTIVVHPWCKDGASELSPTDSEDCGYVSSGPRNEEE